MADGIRWGFLGAAVVVVFHATVCFMAMVCVGATRIGSGLTSFAVGCGSVAVFVSRDGVF